MKFWDSSDYIGLSSYYPLVKDDKSDTSVNALIQGWIPWADKLIATSARVNKPLYFAEVGYGSRKDAPYQPWFFGPPQVLDLEMQARLYDAFGRVWGSTEGPLLKYSSRLARFTIWALYRTTQPHLDTGYTVLDKPAERVVSDLFNRRSKL